MYECVCVCVCQPAITPIPLATAAVVPPLLYHFGQVSLTTVDAAAAADAADVADVPSVRGPLLLEAGWLH